MILVAVIVFFSASMVFWILNRFNHTKKRLSQKKSQLAWLEEKNKLLEASAQEYDEFLNLTQYPIIVLDIYSERIIQISQAFLNLLSYSREEVMNKKFWEIGIPKEMLRIPQKPQESNLISHRISYKEVPLKTNNQKDIFINFSYEIRKVGNNFRVYCDFRDVTAEKWLREELTQEYKNLIQGVAEQEKINSPILGSKKEINSNFISMIQPQLQGSISMIKETLEIHSNQVITQAGEPELMDIALNGSRQLNRFINHLLDITKLESGQMELQQTITDVVELIQNICQIWKTNLSTQGITLASKLPDLSLTMYLDLKRISQVLNNLIATMSKYCSKSDFIRIEFGDFQNDIQISIINENGKGMSFEEINKILTSSSTYSVKLSKLDQENSLDLFISKQIIELHGGKFKAHGDAGTANKLTILIPKIGMDTMVKACIANLIKEATDKKTSVSLLSIHLLDFDILSQTLGRDKVSNILKGLEEVTKKSLRGKFDTIVRSGNEFIVLLFGAKKTDLLYIKKRIESAIGQYFSQVPLHNLRICVSIDSVSYPEEATNSHDLFSQLKLKIVNTNSLTN